MYNARTLYMVETIGCCVNRFRSIFFSLTLSVSLHLNSFIGIIIMDRRTTIMKRINISRFHNEDTRLGFNASRDGPFLLRFLFSSDFNGLTSSSRAPFCSFISFIFFSGDN